MEVLTAVLSALGGAGALGCLVAAVAAYFKAKANQECLEELTELWRESQDENAILRAQLTAKHLTCCLEIQEENAALHAEAVAKDAEIVRLERRIAAIAVGKRELCGCSVFGHGHQPT